MKNIQKKLEEERLKERIKNKIVEYTIEAMHKTALGEYFTDDMVKMRICANIEYIDFRKVLNCESPIIKDGILSIDKSILNMDSQYVKEILTSFGIYSVISDCKKFNVTNDMLATYFSSLAVNGDNYRYIDELKCNSFLRHNLTYSNQISIFHELIGEEAMAVLCSKIDKKHSFYDNLYILIDYMKIPNSLDKKSLKRIEKLMNSMYNATNNTLGTRRIYDLVKNTYFGKFKIIIDKFSTKYSFVKFFKFFDMFKKNKYSIRYIEKEYDISLDNIRLSSEEKMGLSKILDILCNADLSINSYSDIDSRCKEFLELQGKKIVSSREEIVKIEDLIDMLLVTKFVSPLIQKYGLDDKDSKSMQKIFPYILKKK